MAEQPVIRSDSDQAGGEYQPQWSTWARQFAAVLLVIGGVYALTLLAPVIQILIASFLLAFVMFLPSRFVARRTFLNYQGAVIVLYLFLVLVIVLSLIIFIPPFVEGIRNLVNSAQAQITDLQQRLRDYKTADGIITILNFQIDLNFLIQPVRDLVVGSGGESAAGPLAINPADLAPALGMITSTAGGVVGSFLGFTSNAILALFVSFLILLELPIYQKYIYEAVPSPYHREIALLIRKMVNVWNSFFRGQFLVGLIIGVLTWVQLRIMGINGAGALAIFTGLISLIPNIGGIIALAPLAVIPLLNGSTTITGIPNSTLTILVVAVNLIISQVMWNAVAPKILGNALQLPLPVIIVGVVIGSALGGILGAFLIAPILGTLRILVLYILRKIFKQDPYPGEEQPPLPDLSSL